MYTAVCSLVNSSCEIKMNVFLILFFGPSQVDKGQWLDCKVSLCYRMSLCHSMHHQCVFVIYRNYVFGHTDGKKKI